MTTPSGGGGGAMTTTSTPGGYTSRFVAHVAHGQTTAHDEATSNSSNSLDHNRFRAFSADGIDERCSAGRVDDGKVIAATATIADSANDVDADVDALKPQATDTSSAQTDGITDKSTTSSTSSHLAICESENILGDSRDDSRVASVSSEEDALVQGRSGNEDILLIAADRSRDESTFATGDDSDTRRSDAEVTPEKRDFENAPSCFRIIVEDVDAFPPVAEELVLDSTGRTVEMIDERRDRSRSKESHSVSECSSSVSGQTISDSESESDTESGSEEEDEEEDESRDENCNVKNRKKEDKKDEGNYGDKDSAKSEANEENKDSSNSESDEETTVLSISSNIQGECSMTPDDRYERDLKRRSASIIDERSIEEMFDDNGWVVTEQDLEQDLPTDLQTVSTILLDFESTVDRPSEDSIDVNDATGTRTKEIIPRIAEERHDGMSSNLEDSFTRSSIIEDAEMIPSSEWQELEIPPRSRVYRQSSLGKNGWLVSDESESESDRTTSPIEAPSGRDVTKIGSASEAMGIDEIEDSMGDINENGWVILDDGNDDDDDNDDDVDKEFVGANSAQENTGTIRSQTTDLVNSKTDIENGALVANATTRSKGTEQSGPDEHEETPGASMSVPMQMVTTVFCVSVLCYSVLTNLFP